jgi:CelD/BcsL family acetyltransferase involved in cellulose biosynthesis
MASPVPARTGSVQMTVFDALAADELESWQRLRRANPRLDSPFFHPEFAAAVHAVGRTVTVAVARDGDGEPYAFLPGHRDRSTLYPVGWPGSDFQGPVLPLGTPFPMPQLFDAGVHRYAFDHLVETGSDFEPWVEARRPSPFVDTSGGLDGYLGRASRSGKDNMGQARRRAAKAERLHGPVRFAADVVDESALREVIRMKREQYRATGARDFFADPRRSALLMRLLHTRATEFAGVLSTLYAGNHLLAAHFGIRSGPVLHWWFPVYDPAFASLAPGWILLRELVAAAPALGVTRLDLGRGEDEYKRRAKTGEVLVSQGLATRSRTHRAVRRARHAVVAAARSSALGPAVRGVARRIRRLADSPRE